MYVLQDPRLRLSHKDARVSLVSGFGVLVSDRIATDRCLPAEATGDSRGFPAGNVHLVETPEFADSAPGAGHPNFCR